MIPYEVLKDENSDTTKIQCGYCSKIFETVQQHEQHRCRKENNFIGECLSCKKPYNDHAVQNEDSLSKDPKASKDETATASEGTAQTTPEQPKETWQLYRCCLCSKSYTNMIAMVRHIKYHMSRKTGVMTEHCSYCKKAFTTKQQLNRHLAVHKDLRPFKCEQCDKWFKTADSVKRHMYVHSEATPFSCHICSREFKARHLMKKHVETHSDDKNYECQKCGKKFKARNSLRDHLLVHDGTRPYKCDQCDQAFYRRSHLATHKTVHSEAKPFACKVCEKGFGRREHLKVHERIHSGEKPFKCTQCERSFNQQAGLQAHRISHSEERPYTCLTCKKTFKYRSQVKHHACKRDEIGPCMVDMHGITTVEERSPSSESTTAINSPETATACEEQENETAPVTAEISNATSPSEAEDTIILIQIENTTHTDETAMSVDIVTTHENNAETRTNPLTKESIPGTNTNMDANVPISELESKGERRHDANTLRTTQTICDSGAANISRTHRDISGSHQIVAHTHIDCEGRHPNTSNSQGRFVSPTGNMAGENVNILGNHGILTETPISDEGRYVNYAADTHTKFASASSNVAGSNVDFSETHSTAAEKRMTQGRYSNATNTLERYGSAGKGNFTIARHYNAATVDTGTIAFATRPQTNTPVCEAYMRASHGLTLEQGDNLTNQANIVWSHVGIRPLVGNARTAEQNTMGILSNQFHQPVSSGETDRKSHDDMLSGLPHLWNRS